MPDPQVEFPHTDMYPPRPPARDREGRPIDLDSLEAMWEQPQNRVVLFTSLVDPDGTRMAVSTIWLGIDHAFQGDPLVYETAVFDGSGLVQRARHRDEAAAATGHVEALLQLIAHGALPKTDAERIVTGSLPVTVPQPEPAALPVAAPPHEPDLDEVAARFEEAHRQRTGPTPTEGTPHEQPAPDR